MPTEMVVLPRAVDAGLLGLFPELAGGDDAADGDDDGDDDADAATGAVTAAAAAAGAGAGWRGDAPATAFTRSWPRRRST